MSSDGGGLQEWLDQFNAAIARWTRARKNEGRWLPALSEQIVQAVKQKRDFYAAFGLAPEDANEVNDLIHGTRQQRLIERIRQARIDAETGVRRVCDELQTLSIRFSPNGQEDATVRLGEWLSHHPLVSREGIRAVVEKLKILQSAATVSTSIFVEASSGLPAQNEELSRKGRHRGPDLKMSRQRIELVDRLRGELTRVIHQRNVAAFTGPGDLKQSYPEFALWKLVSPEQLWSDLCSDERFRFRHYADILVCQQYQLTDVSSLNKDRAKLRRAGRSNLGC